MRDGLNAGSLALMLVVTLQLGQAAIFPKAQVDWISLAIAVVSAGVLFWKPKLNSAWLILAAAGVSLALPQR